MDKETRIPNDIDDFNAYCAGAKGWIVVRCECLICGTKEEATAPDIALKNAPLWECVNCGLMQSKPMQRLARIDGKDYWIDLA